MKTDYLPSARSQRRELCVVKSEVGNIKYETHVDFSFSPPSPDDSVFALWTTWGHVSKYSKNEYVQLNIYERVQKGGCLPRYGEIELRSENTTYEDEIPVSTVVIVVQVPVEDLRVALRRGDSRLLVKIKSISEEVL